ncbi:O-antigen ligase family protein [Crocosphaera sp. Alani8]|uniref:O-antigen ligase family protein n=1 Tax=Crocosphaera sp. Alani8 TaxID=3038952 RepID=UPI00313CA93F
MLLQKHLDPQLRVPWYCAQVGIFIFPVSQFSGSIFLLLSFVTVYIEKRQEIQNNSINWGFACLGFLLIITVFLSSNYIAGVKGLVNFLPYFFIFAFFSQLVQHYTQLKQLTWILFLSAFPILLLGFGQIFLEWAGPIKWGLIVNWHLHYMGNPTYRMSSVFYHANFCASYLVTVFILGLGLLLAQFLRPISLNNLIKAIILIICNSLIVIALILTHSRNAWMVTFLSCLAFILYLSWYWLLIPVATGITIVFSTAFGNFSFQNRLQSIIPIFIWGRLNDSLYPERDINTLRITQWKFAWNFTIQSPWIGGGLGNFGYLYEAETQTFISHPHNLILMLTSEVGIPATLCLYSLVGWIVIKGVILFKSLSNTYTIRNDFFKTISKYYKSKNLKRIIKKEFKVIIFSYLVALLSYAIFNIFDVVIFDTRVNLLPWLLLSSINGLTLQKSGIN